MMIQNDAQRAAVSFKVKFKEKAFALLETKNVTSWYPAFHETVYVGDFVITPISILTSGGMYNTDPNVRKVLNKEVMKVLEEAESLAWTSNHSELGMNKRLGRSKIVEGDTYFHLFLSLKR